ncbi:hypothetical protein RDI58_005009 [Solanum bulbocastanum]|uniref:Uncharacterized protein n=1 Tax=Solanum bulbocastanum TaxID=147425 RepID=A0AAN8YM56_SOLBU
MAEISDISHATALDITDDNEHHILSCPCLASKKLGDETISFTQKLVAELLGTYLSMFAGFAAMVVNKNIGLLGIAVLWGLDMMVMIYTVGPVSGAHFNPAVTVAFASCKRIAWRHVPAYILAQVMGATLATVTVRLMFNEEQLQFLRTIPAGSDLQSLGLEFLITFYLMFAVAGTTMDNRAVSDHCLFKCEGPRTEFDLFYPSLCLLMQVGELTGHVIGAVITINSILLGLFQGHQ